MIEILEMKDKPEKLDITPQLAIAALNTMMDYCEQVKCKDCIFSTIITEGGRDYCDEYLSDCFSNMERIEIPLIDGNTVTYFDDNKLHRTTCGNRQEAEELLEKVRKR